MKQTDEIKTDWNAITESVIQKLRANGTWKFVEAEAARRNITPRRMFQRTLEELDELCRLGEIGRRRTFALRWLSWTIALAAIALAAAMVFKSPGGVLLTIFILFATTVLAFLGVFMLWMVKSPEMIRAEKFLIDLESRKAGG